MEGKQIGTVFNYFENIGVVAIELAGNIKLGDTLRFVGGDTDFIEVVDSIQINGKNLESAKKGDKIGMKISEKVRKGYKVYRV